MASYRTESRFPEGRPAYQVVVGCDLKLADSGVLSKALTRLGGAMVGPTKRQAEEWVVMLSVACAGGRKTDLHHEATMELYSALLGRFPADVAKQACTNLALRAPKDGANWFPSLAEINAECDRLSAPRRAILTALRNWREATPEERRSEAVRDRLMKAKEIENDSFLYRRSDPERFAQMAADAKNLRSEADMLRRGELQP